MIEIIRKLYHLIHEIEDTNLRTEIYKLLLELESEALNVDNNSKG